MVQNRPNPDALLASIQKEEARQRQGKFKIFLGMCPGVGKTYAMLQAARQREAEGIDVLVGVAETHGRKETEALLDGLAIASKVKRPYKNTVLEEMDLDTVLAIRPQLAIVDELAHTNAPGSRHPKRYQDVLELLASGIDVYATLNVQHVESRAEAVRQIAGIQVQESVPDSVLDRADEITLIDLSPEQLRQRLKEGKVYMGERAVTAADNFFREENLTALREMALRFTAERVNQDLREIMHEQGIQGPWKAGELLMVAIGPTPYSESLIRWTRRAAAALNAPWLAVYVETSEELDENEKNRLTKNLTLARQLGAEVVVRSGADVADVLLQAARENNVTQICVGKPSGGLLRQFFRGGAFVQQLIRKSGDIDIHMVRVKSLGASKQKVGQKVFSFGSLGEYQIALGILLAVTVLCVPVDRLAGYSAVSLVYLLGVVISGLILGRLPVFILGALSALLWNFLFIPPRFTFFIYKSYDAIMFGMFFAVSLVMGQITTRLREREKSEKKQEERVSILYQLTRTMALTHDSKEAIRNSLNKLKDVMKVDAAIFLADEKGRPDFDKSNNGNIVLTGKEKSVAHWVFQKQQPAGRYTDTLPVAENFYLPLVSMNKTLGVLCVYPLKNPVWTLDQRSLMESLASLMTVILEKHLLSSMAEEAKIKIESEKLQSALLDSVSHELKTPLTVIAGSSEHLEKNKLNPEDTRRLVSEIRIASRRLLQTVNGLLDMTRLDSEHLQLNLDWHDMRDVVRSAVENAGTVLEHHKKDVRFAVGLPLVRIDALIIQQVLANLLSNAAAYSPQESEIAISVLKDAGNLKVSVADQGPGIPEEDLEKIFEKFYRGKSAKTGGLGLGLSIAKRFLQAHGGELEARNLSPKGACLIMILPVEFFHAEAKDIHE